ncbi:probable cyclin-dependent serine/threonine-protein kinase DDB_G0292550 [Colias croceus]|uniref:probable cyclin-dependent serine/threonine-protein kinase DDB_G0292550 n=1 Tax=Colias crocea TaxID=72248 RepID=UPI001E27ABB0|nr:probable cyclin-dependent serine/threonine-protein kinase DDB_G0292550 [Colias croceus]
MFLPLYTVAALVNIIAKANNYNINTAYNPDFDIRVKRYVNNDRINKIDISRDVNVNYVKNIDKKHEHKYVDGVNEDSEPVNVYIDEDKQENDFNKEIGIDSNKQIVPKGYGVNKLNSGFKDNYDISTKQFSIVNELISPNEIYHNTPILNNKYIQIINNDQMKEKNYERHKRSYYLPIYMPVTDGKVNATKKQNKTIVPYYQLSDTIIPNYNHKNNNSNIGQPIPMEKNNTFFIKNHTKYDNSSSNSRGSNIFPDLSTKNYTNSINNTTNLPTTQNPLNSTTEEINSNEMYEDYDNGGNFVWTVPKKVDIYQPTPKVDKKPTDTQKNKTKGEKQLEINFNTANKSSTLERKNDTKSQFNNTKSLSGNSSEGDVKEIKQTKDIFNQKDNHYRVTRATKPQKELDFELDYENYGDFIVHRRPKPVAPKKQGKPLNKDKKNNNTPRPKDDKNNSTPRPPSTPRNDPKNKTNKPRPVKTATKDNKKHSSAESSESNVSVERTKISLKNNDFNLFSRWHSIGRKKRSYYLPIPDDEDDTRKTNVRGRKPNRGYYPLSDTHVPVYTDGYDISNFEGDVRPYPKKNAWTTPPPKRYNERTRDDEYEVRPKNSRPTNKNRNHRIEPSPSQRDEYKSDEGIVSSLWKSTKSIFGRKRRSIDNVPSHTAPIRKRKSVSDFFYNIIDK